MKPLAYYNELDPYAADWLENLILVGLIAPGDVDRRSIEDVTPNDLRGYTQCHFFAGIGVWSYALRLAGWPDDRPVWTGSCPCQPFSAAGKGKGTADERHLWPAWFWLIEQCRPRVVFGEQVEAAIKHDWLDLVQADLEGIGYSTGAVGIPAAGVGAPHGRARLWFVGHTDEPARERRAGSLPRAQAPQHGAGFGQYGGVNHGFADAGEGLGTVADSNGRNPGAEGLQRGGQQPGRLGAHAAGSTAEGGGASFWSSCDWLPCREGMDDAAGARLDGARQGPEGEARDETRLRGPERGRIERATAGFWHPADWLPCRDGKARPVEPIALKMVDGSAESLGRLRPEAIQEVEKEVADAFRRKADAREALRDLWRSLLEEAPGRWETGRLLGLHEAPFLLAFLRQLEDQGWAFSQGVSRAGEEAAKDALRSVRSNDPIARPPQERGLARQPAGEHSDTMRVLSSILAFHAQASWGETFRRHADDAFPLISGASARVGRLRAYGNSIVAPLAAEVIRAYMECRPC